MLRNSLFTSLLLVVLTPLGADAKTTATVTDGGDVVLANQNASLTFGGGNDFKFKNFNMSGKELLPEAGSTAFPWQLTYLGPVGENPQLRPQWGVYRAPRSLSVMECLP